MNLYEYSEIHIYVNLAVQTHIRLIYVLIHDTSHNVLTEMHLIIGDFKAFTRYPSADKSGPSFKVARQGALWEFGLTARVDGQKAWIAPHESLARRWGSRGPGS